MSDMIEDVAKAMWDQRRAWANGKGIWLEFWGDGSLPKANGIMEEARAAIEALEAAGYVVVRKQPVQQPQQGSIKAAQGGDSYNARADGATTFDPETQFEKDNGL